MLYEVITVADQAVGDAVGHSPFAAQDRAARRNADGVMAVPVRVVGGIHQGHVQSHGAGLAGQRQISRDGPGAFAGLLGASHSENHLRIVSDVQKIGAAHVIVAPGVVRIDAFRGDASYNFV